MRKLCSYCGISFNKVSNSCPQCLNLWLGKWIGDLDQEDNKNQEVK